jgi:hypothetical protein
MTSKRQANVENVPTADRFKFSLDDSRFDELSKGFQPKNTVANTSWAIRVFEEWKKARNSSVDFQDNVCPSDLLSNGKKGDLWLGRFAIEVRRQDGQPYPPRTIHQLLLGIQRQVRILRADNKINFFGDAEFCKLQNVCDSLFCELHSAELEQNQKLHQY